MKTEKRDGFAFVEVMVVIAIIALIAAMLLWTYQKIVMPNKQAVMDVTHMIASKGIDTSEPIHITNGWYYISATQTNANLALASFIRSQVGTNDVAVNVYSGIDDDGYGAWNSTLLITKVAQRLGIKGYFVVISCKP